jgi:hypothetical protein
MLLMNDKIKQLAKEAGYYLYDLTETHECKTVETDSKDEWITLEKFAELIVRECIAQCEKNAEHSYLGPGSKLSAFNIKEHFGIEE